MYHTGSKNATKGDVVDAVLRQTQVAGAGTLDDPVTGLLTEAFNGAEVAGGAYTGGPLVTEDVNGKLGFVPLNVPAVAGWRYATTVAEGAELGPELIPQPLNLVGLHRGWSLRQPPHRLPPAVLVAKP